MKDSKSITITIPENLITPEGFSSNYVDKAIVNRPTVTVAYTLSELVGVKGDLTTKAKELSSKVSNDKKLTLKQLKETLLEMKVANHNLNIVKETISIANTPICPSIYTKSTLEAQRVALNNRKKITPAKEEKTLKFLNEELEQGRLSINSAKEELPVYNDAVRITLQFYK